MGTTIRPELSEKNPYWIERHRYYHLKSRSGIDLAISKALKDKRDFNESRFVKW